MTRGPRDPSGRPRAIAIQTFALFARVDHRSSGELLSSRDPPCRAPFLLSRAALAHGASRILLNGDPAGSIEEMRQQKKRKRVNHVVQEQCERRADAACPNRFPATGKIREKEKVALSWVTLDRRAPSEIDCLTMWGRAASATSRPRCKMGRRRNAARRRAAHTRTHTYGRVQKCTYVRAHIVLLCVRVCVCV